MKRVRMMIEVETHSNRWDDATVEVNSTMPPSDPEYPIVQLRVVENLMAMVAMGSKLDFEAALEMLVEGARNVKVIEQTGQKGAVKPN